MPGDVRGDERALAERGRGHLAGEPVEVDRGDDRPERLPGPLREQPGGQPREYVTRPRRRHPGVARRVDVDRAVRRRDQRAAALEHGDHPPGRRELARDPDTIGEYLVRPPAGEPRHLARVRRDHQRQLVRALQVLAPR